MKSLSMATAFLLTLSGMGVVHADDTKFVLGHEYMLSMTGCLDKTEADTIAAQAHEKGSGRENYLVLLAKQRCGKTVGLTRFTELYDQYTDSGGTAGPVWYASYEVKLEDGTWKTFFGFCVYPVVPQPSI